MAGRNSKGVNTRSLARRINAGSWFRLLLCFVIINCVVFAMNIIPDVSSEALTAEVQQLLYGQKYYPLFAAEIFLLIMKLIFGALPIRRVLRPVDDIADVAFALGSKEGGFDEEKFRNLQAAIDRISPVAEDARLRTGDKQLEGLELAVNNLIERMRESYAQQARFVSDASHELRTPIAVIKGYADMLDRWGKSDEKVLEESIEAIKTESEHMNHLVEQLLFLARGDSGRNKMELEEFDLCAMIREVYDESVMIDPAHSYFCSADGQVMVTADISMLKQTARILIDNAKKYTAEGENIYLGAKLDNGEPCFVIQDSGIGIPGGDIEHVFERFYRADSSRARETGSTGLGLAIAKWIIDRHNGRIYVLSREGIGTRISIYLPRQS